MRTVLIAPIVPDGVHPWAPAEQEFTAKLRPLITAHLRIARDCVGVGSDILDRAQGVKNPDVFRVHAILAVRVLQDLRACVLSTLRGYTMQAWSIASSAFEAAHTMGFVGDDSVRAIRWMEHPEVKVPVSGTFDSVRHTLLYLGIESDLLKLDDATKESYAIYELLCAAKHVNPVAERERYIYNVEGKPNLVLSPVFTPRRAAEARLGLLLAIRSASVALWVLDVTHLSAPGLVDDRIRSLVAELGDLTTSWKDDVKALKDEMRADRTDTPAGGPTG